MIRRITLKNFLSFKDLSFDLSKGLNGAKHLALIYGENGAGKTNLIEAIGLLALSIRTLKESKNISRLMEAYKETENDATRHMEVMQELIRNNYFMSTRIDSIINTHKMIGSSGDTMILEYDFVLQDKSNQQSKPFTYLMEFDDEAIVREVLYYKLASNKVRAFEITKGNPYLNQSLFKEANLKAQILERITQYWGKHTLLSIIVDEYEMANRDYIVENTDAGLVELIEYLQTIVVYNKDFVDNSDQDSYIEGIAKEDYFNKNILPKQEIVKKFFQALYADIVDVYYSISTNKSGSIQYELVFRKNVDGVIRDIPVSYESSGTKKLITLIPLIENVLLGNTVWVDEFDQKIHDILASILFKSLIDNHLGQFVSTTHNTTLMETTASNKALKECIYIIDSHSDGEKEIVCLDEYSIKETNNLRKMYLNGRFGGISFASDLSLSYVFNMDVES